jgi:hypothetical protein
MAGNIPSQRAGGTIDLGERRRRAAGLAVATLAAAALACAGVPVADEPPGPPPFQGLSRLVLVRSVDERGARPKDPLDALRESLTAQGRTARGVDLAQGGHRNDALATLYRTVEARVFGGSATGASTVVSLGADAARALRDEGADGAVLYYRRAGRLPVLPPAPVPGAFGAEPLSMPPGAPPVAALALVDRDGHLVWFGWGSGDPSRTGPNTAAEAVDVLLRVIEGTPVSDALDG